MKKTKGVLFMKHRVYWLQFHARYVNLAIERYNQRYGKVIRCTWW